MSNDLKTNKKIATGVFGFDEISLGGLANSQSTLITGTSGSGKTIFCGQFLFFGVKMYNENGLFVTFEEKPNDLKLNFLQLGWDFSTLEKENRLVILDASQSRGHSTMIVGKYDLNGLRTRVENVINKINCKRVVLDSISSLFLQFDDPTIVRSEIYKLLEFLKQKGVTTLMTGERQDDYGPISRFGVEEYLVDHVIILRNKLEKDKRRRTIEILKYRGSDHKRGEQPFIIIEQKGIVVLPVASLDLRNKTSNERVSSGNLKLDEMCGGGFFRDSIILVSGATGTGKTLMATEFICGGFNAKEKVILFAFEEFEDQIIRHSLGWGIDFNEMQNQGLLKIVSIYPESISLEEHLFKIMDVVEEFKPNRIAIDSLSAIERGNTTDVFRTFVVSLTSFLKKKEITTLITSTNNSIDGENGGNHAHLPTIADSIIALQYIEILGKIHRVMTILKMRGSKHEKNIYEYFIGDKGLIIDSVFEKESGIVGSTTR